MPRLKRCIHAGESFHVFDRGNNKQRIFFGNYDYAIFMAKALCAAQKHQILIHAWALMPNHFHFFLTAKTASSVSIFMRALKGGYGQYFNRRHKRTGTIWESRYRAVLVEGTRYSLQIYRYIELNPTRARLVRRPSEWPWSSVGINALGKPYEGQVVVLGAGGSPPPAPEDVIVPHPYYLLLGETPESRQRAYRRFIAAASGEDQAMYEAQVAVIAAAQSKLSVFGSAAFVAQCCARDKQNYAGITEIAHAAFPDLSPQPSVEGQVVGAGGEEPPAPTPPHLLEAVRHLLEAARELVSD